MPIAQAPISQDWGLSRVKVWKLHFNLWPRKCFLSGKPLWFKRSYKGIQMITGPGDPVFCDYYIEKSEFIMWNLKGKK